MAISPAGGIIRKQKKIVTAFRASGATSVNHATTVASLGISRNVAFRILRRHDILCEVGEQQLFYLDELKWEALQTKRRRFVVIILGIVLLIWIFWITFM